jgi:hypothetical protein
MIWVLGIVVVGLAFVLGFRVGGARVSEVAERDWRRLNWMSNRRAMVKHDGNLWYAQWSGREVGAASGGDLRKLLDSVIGE